MRRLIALALLSVFLALPVQAETIKPKLIPVGRKLVCKGERVKAFTLDEWKLALSLDDELWRARAVKNLLEEQLELQDEQILELGKLRVSLNKDLELTKTEVAKMTELWEAENKARHLAEASRDWWRIAALSTGGVLATAALTAYLLR